MVEFVSVGSNGMQLRRGLSDFANPAMKNFPGQFSGFLTFDRLRNRLIYRQPVRTKVPLLGQQVGRAQKRLQFQHEPACGVIEARIGRSANFTNSLRRLHSAQHFARVD